MALKRIHAVITTSHPIAAYGGVQFDESVIEAIAEAVASGEMPMHFSHGVTRPIEVTNVRSGTERLADGHLAAWAEFDVETDEWDANEAARDAVGAARGMTVSVYRAIGDREELVDPPVFVGADASYFSDVDIAEAARMLGPIGPANIAHLYQFAFVPDPKVVIEFNAGATESLSLNVLAAALYDAAKTFMRPGRDTIFSMMVRKSPRGHHTLKLHIATSDTDALRVATGHAADLLQKSTEGTFAYNPSSEAFDALEPRAPSK
jgi:hypothetical protein